MNEAAGLYLFHIIRKVDGRFQYDLYLQEAFPQLLGLPSHGTGHLSLHYPERLFGRRKDKGRHRFGLG